MAMEKEEATRAAAAAATARRMMTAARTAPKAHGTDSLEMAYITGEDLQQLAEKMAKLAEKLDMPFFLRDSACIKKSLGAIVIGTKFNPLGLKNCGFCGHVNCTEKAKLPNVPCAFNTGDLGVAIGSAVSVAADMRTDTRVMFSAGKAALEMQLLGPEVKIAYVLPLSITGKSPFFDR